MNHETQLWHVCVTVGGDPHEPPKTRAALVRLIAESPFIHSVRYDARRAEVRYWEESPEMVDAASLALRMWREHRTSADLPDWKVIGLEVVERETFLARQTSPPTGVGDVTPRRF